MTKRGFVTFIVGAVVSVVLLKIGMAWFLFAVGLWAVCFVVCLTIWMVGRHRGHGRLNRSLS